MKFAVSLAATEATDAEGRPLVRGGELDFSPEQRENPFNQRLIAENQLISIARPRKAQEEAADAVNKNQEGGATQ